jgi:glycosyltransferase involved in cell wall biosynthesis
LQTSLSVLVPVFNEQYLVAESLRRLLVLEQSPYLDRIEVIVVDDCSRDATPEVLAEFAAARAAAPTRIAWTWLRHEVNQGKGRAIRTALDAATCEITVIHDADLEYHPEDLLRVVEVFVKEGADAVFGSRFAGGEVRRVLLYRHQLGNRLLTTLSNLATNLNLTDMETCYKAVRTDLLRSIPLVSNDFRIEPELTIKLAKRQARIFEVPISYSGRTYVEGKKINWRDGVKALVAIARFTLSDHIYKDDEYGSQILARLSRAPRFNAWMAEVIRDYCGERVLEIGGGVGNLTLRLVPRQTFVVSDINPLYLQTLRALTHGRPYLDVEYCDVSKGETFPSRTVPYDTVICLNVVEHIEDDEQALRNIAGVLAPDGRALILVPQGPGNFGTLDEVLGHHRRYTRDSLTAVAQRAGFEVDEILSFNRFGSIAWFLNGRILKRRNFGFFQIKLLNLIVPLMKAFERVSFMPPLSLIAVLRPAGAPPRPRPVSAARATTPQPGSASTSMARVGLVAAWTLLALVALAGALRDGRAYATGVGDAQAMCRGLPTYETVTDALAGQATVDFVVAADAERRAERFFCAQHALVPSLLRARPVDQLTAPSDTDVVLVDLSGAPSPSPAVDRVVQTIAGGELAVTGRAGDLVVLRRRSR